MSALREAMRCDHWTIRVPREGQLEEGVVDDQLAPIPVAIFSWRVRRPAGFDEGARPLKHEPHQSKMRANRASFIDLWAHAGQPVADDDSW